jgi:hypothetical protein
MPVIRTKHRPHRLAWQPLICAQVEQLVITLTIVQKTNLYENTHLTHNFTFVRRPLLCVTGSGGTIQGRRQYRQAESATAFDRGSEVVTQAGMPGNASTS